MKFFWDLDSNRIGSTTGSRGSSLRVTWKKGDAQPVSLTFTRGAQPVEPPAGWPLVLALKESGKYDSPIVAFADDFVSPEEDVFAIDGVINLNTVEIGEIMPSDEDTGNDLSEVDLMGEFTLSLPGGKWLTSPTFEVCLQNDVLRDETEPSPAIPPSGGVAEAIADGNLGSGTFIHLFADGPATMARLANATAGYPANGFTRAAVMDGEIVTVEVAGTLNGFSGIVPGSFLWLRDNGLFSSTPPSTGISQRVGTGLASDEILVDIEPPVTL